MPLEFLDAPAGADAAAPETPAEAKARIAALRADKAKETRERNKKAELKQGSNIFALRKA